jgi:hypothetical protein
MARLFGCVAGVRALLQEVEVPRNPASHGATEGAQGYELASYGGAPFDYYEAEILVLLQEGEVFVGPKRTPIASYWLRSGDSESAGTRDAVGFSRLSTGQVTVPAIAVTGTRIFDANPYRRRALISVVGVAGQLPTLIGPDQTLVGSQGFALQVNGPAVELRDTRGLYAWNTDAADVNLTWLTESA